MYSKSQRDLIINVAERDLKNAIASKDKRKISQEINMSENVLIATCRFTAKGTETLRKMIFDAERMVKS